VAPPSSKIEEKNREGGHFREVSMERRKNRGDEHRQGN